jgi:hypothetical protein
MAVPREERGNRELPTLPSELDAYTDYLFNIDEREELTDD